MQSQSLWATSLWVILSLILLIVLVIMALRPTLVTISSLVGQIKQQEEVSQKLDEKILSVRRALDEADKVKGKLYLLNNALPNDPLWEMLADELRGIATDSGLILTSIIVDKIPLAHNEPGPVGSVQAKLLVPDKVLPVKFTMTATGGYDQIMDAVAKVQKMSRVIMISTVGIELNKTNGLDLTVSGQAGYLPDMLL